MLALLADHRLVDLVDDAKSDDRVVLVRPMAHRFSVTQPADAIDGGDATTGTGAEAGDGGEAQGALW